MVSAACSGLRLVELPENYAAAPPSREKASRCLCRDENAQTPASPLPVTRMSVPGVSGEIAKPRLQPQRLAAVGLPTKNHRQRFSFPDITSICPFKRTNNARPETSLLRRCAVWFAQLLLFRVCLDREELAHQCGHQGHIPRYIRYFNLF
jgi:hypothetical protein